MRRIIVATTDDAPSGAGPMTPHITTPGTFDVRRLLDGDKAPIHLTAYRLSDRAQIDWDESERCRTLYINKGALTIKGQRFGSASAIIIEGGAECGAEATPNTELYEFLHNREIGDLRGGNVHGIAGGAAQPIHHDGIDSALPVDSTCPGCGVWLQETSIEQEGFVAEQHQHTEDEVILVLDGELLAGPRKLGPGAALSVAKNTLYGFTVGKGGVRFINFRPSHPYYATQGSKEVFDELEFYRARGLKPTAYTMLS